MGTIAERFLVRFLALTKPIVSCLETLPWDWFHVELSQKERQRRNLDMISLIEHEIQ